MTAPAHSPDQPQGKKRSRKMLAFWAFWIIIAQWINLYWVVMPEFSEHFTISIMDLTCFAGIGGIWIAGITRLVSWGVAAVFVAALCAVSGVTLFSLGATFNYLVSLFHKQPIRQGLLGKPLFRQPLERHFGWMGLGAMGLGLVVGFVSLILSLDGWSVDRLWLYLLGAAMLLIVGLQLAVFWVITRVLAELSQREVQVAQDLEGAPLELEPEGVLCEG